MGKRCSIACIIPPVLLEELARSGGVPGAGGGALCGDLQTCASPPGALE